MKIVTKIQSDSVPKTKRKRVAAYARVSKSTDRLMHSVSAQVNYYSELIQNNPEWEYAGVYADYFVSGTGTEKRQEFNRLLSDCEAGMIDMILCKSISRFARNTVDLLNTVRHLKEIGIEVRFEKENISSLSKDGELMLTILASFAQEESRSISENVKWGVRKRFQSGEIGAANKHILGYQYDEELQQYVIIPKEAEIIRWVFQMYLDGVSLRLMAKAMNDAGVRSILGNEFSEGSVRNIIFNEIYVGDLRRQKCYMEDPITKRKVINRGELPQYLMTDCHEAIIDRETYAKVQAEMKRREGMLNPTYCFTGKIRCGKCGRTYSRKKNISKGRVYCQWVCRAKKEMGVNCESATFSEQELMNISAAVLGTDSFDEKRFIADVTSIDVQPNGDLFFHLTGGKIQKWKNLHVTDFHHRTTITECFENRIFCECCGNSYHIHKDGKYIYWQCRGKYLTNVHCRSKNYTDYQLRQVSAFMLSVSEFSETSFTEQIDKIIVHKDGNLQFHFTDGRIRIWQRT